MTPEELFREVREVLIADPTNAWRGDADYAVRDPALIDPEIARILRASFRGQTLSGPRDVRRLAMRARGAYTALINEPAARAQIEAQMAARYAAPRVSWDRGLLIADHGITPGLLERRGRAGWTVYASEVIDRGEWRTEEAAGALTRLRAEHPEAGALSARVVVPVGSNTTRYDYRWIPSQDRLILSHDGASNIAWVQADLGGDLGPWLRGERSLHTGALHRTSMTRKLSGWDPDAPF